MSGLFDAAPMTAGVQGLRDRRSSQYIGLALARVPGRICLRAPSQPVAITSFHPRTLRCYPSPIPGTVGLLKNPL